MCIIRNEIATEVPHLKRFAFSLVGAGNQSDADDLVQDTVERALTSAASFSEGTNLRAWLFTILKNSFLSGRRRDSVKHRYAQDRFQSGNDTQPANQNTTLFLRQAAEAIADLKPKERDTLIRLGVLEESGETVAQCYREPVGTTKSRLSRTRAKLRSSLGVMSSGDVARLAA